MGDKYCWEVQFMFLLPNSPIALSVPRFLDSQKPRNGTGYALSPAGEELDFAINYDVKYRMGASAGEGDE